MVFIPIEANLISLSMIPESNCIIIGWEIIKLNTTSPASKAIIVCNTENSGILGGRVTINMIPESKLHVY